MVPNSIDFVLGFMSEMGIGVIDLYSTVIELLTHVFTIPGYETDFTAFAMIFSVSGLSTYIIVTLVKWVIGVIT